MIGDRSVIDELLIDREAGDKEKGSDLWGDDQRVLRGPADAGVAGVKALQNRARVDEELRAAARLGLLDLGEKILKPPPQRAVVVPRTGVAGDPSEAGSSIRASFGSIAVRQRASRRLRRCSASG